MNRFDFEVKDQGQRYSEIICSLAEMSIVTRVVFSWVLCDGGNVSTSLMMLLIISLLRFKCLLAECKRT